MLNKFAFMWAKVPRYRGVIPQMTCWALLPVCQINHNSSPGACHELPKWLGVAHALSQLMRRTWDHNYSPEGSCEHVCSHLWHCLMTVMCAHWRHACAPWLSSAAATALVLTYYTSCHAVYSQCSREAHI